MVCVLKVMKLIIDTIINALQSLTIEQFKFNSHITCKMQAIMRPNDKYIICLKQYYISNGIDSKSFSFLIIVLKVTYVL